MGLETALIGGILGAAGSVAGSAINSAATGSAVDKQTQAQNDSIKFQQEQAAKADQLLRQQSDQARQDLQPFRDSQVSALNQLNQLADPNSSLANAQRDIATQAIQRQLAAQGLLRSKKQTDLLGNVELGLAQQRAGILQGLAGSGAAQQQAGISQGLGQNLANNALNLGGQIGSSFQNIGQIQGQGAIANANAITGGLAGLNNAIQGTFTNYANLQQQRQNNELNQAILMKLFGQNLVNPNGAK